MKFTLKSDYSPTGDQPRAIGDLSRWVGGGQAHQTLLGVTGSGKTFSLANVIEQVQKPTLVISHNKTLAAQLYQEFRDYFPGNAVSYFVSYYDYYQPEAYIPSSDTYIEKETDINQEIDKLRLSATANLLSRPDTIVVASVSCIYNLGSPVEYGENFLELTPGQKISPTTVVNRLVDMQYTRNDYQLARSCFRLRGDTLQVWPSEQGYALTLEFLGDTLELIVVIEPVSGDELPSPPNLPLRQGEEKSSKGPNRFVLYPAKHYVTNEKTQDSAIREIKTDLVYRLQELKEAGKMVEAYRLGQKVGHDLEMIQELGYVNGIENYSRYFDGRKPGDPPYSLLDYFKYNAGKFGGDENGFLTIVDESHITLPQLRGMYAGDQSRKQTLIDYGFRLPSALDNRPLKFDEILERLPQIVYASATPEEWELQRSEDRVTQQLIRPTGLVDPPIEIRPSKEQIPDLIREIAVRMEKGQRTLVTTLTKRTSEDLTDYLNEPKKIAKALGAKPKRLPKVAYLHADIETLERSDILNSLRQGEYDVVVGINLLREGLDLPEVSLVAILEADKQGFLRSRTSLIQTMGRAARHHEGLVIMYADRRSAAMEEAIDEVERRREVQIEYNRQHGIVPQTIVKPFRERLLEKQDDSQMEKIPEAVRDYAHLGWETMDDIDPASLTPKDKKALIRKLTRQMNQAAKDWEFERAAMLRDTVKLVKGGRGSEVTR